ncbi:hypothetical protein O3P69_000718 [Scylla paramamosain]|uniref:Uncharacterized protein n=1 Tax=Scylla paramamosain TaxID=85552 RepID=A0AAW0UUW6_SCYPA
MSWSTGLRPNSFKKSEVREEYSAVHRTARSLVRCLSPIPERRDQLIPRKREGAVCVPVTWSSLSNVPVGRYCACVGSGGGVTSVPWQLENHGETYNPQLKPSRLLPPLCTQTFSSLVVSQTLLSFIIFLWCLNSECLLRDAARQGRAGLVPRRRSAYVTPAGHACEERRMCILFTVHPLYHPHTKPPIPFPPIHDLALSSPPHPLQSIHRTIYPSSHVPNTPILFTHSLSTHSAAAMGNSAAHKSPLRTLSSVSLAA